MVWSNHTVIALKTEGLQSGQNKVNLKVDFYPVLGMPYRLAQIFSNSWTEVTSNGSSSPMKFPYEMMYF